MTLVHPKHLKKATDRVQIMSMAEKEAEFDIIFREQPNLLASVVVQQKMGNTMEQMEALLHLLLVIHLSLKDADISLEPVSEDLQEQQLRRLTKRILFIDELEESSSAKALSDQLEALPEKWLYAYAVNTMQEEGFLNLTHENSKYLILCGLNLVNCINPH